MVDLAFQELLLYAEILGKDDPHVAKCLEKASRQKDPNDLAKYKQHFVRLLESRGIKAFDLPAFGRPEKAEEGEIYAGDILLGDRPIKPLSVRLSSFAEHSLVAGHSGAGKSFFLRFLIPQFAEKRTAVWIFDREREYRSLLKSKIAESVRVIRPSQDRFNFLEPPNCVGPEEWIAKIKSVFRESFFLLDGSINLLDHLIRNLYKNRGVFDGSKNYPTLLDLIRLCEAVEFKPGTRFYGFRESLLNRLLGLQGELGEALACAKGYAVESLAQNIWIFELSGLSDDKASFYISEKFLRLFAYCESLPPVDLRLIAVIDEAHALFNEKTAKRYDLGEGLLFTSARTARKRGIGFVYSDQTPSLLPQTITSNVSNFFIMRLVNAKDIRFIANALGLSLEQAERIHTLPKAHCIFQSPSQPNAVLVRIPALSFDFVSQSEVDDRMKSIFASLSYEPAEGKKREEEQEIQADELGEASRGEAEEADGECEAKTADEMRLPGEKGKARRRRQADKPNRLWIEIVKIVCELGWVPISSLAEQLASVPPWVLRKALAEMARSSLIELCPVNFGARGSPRTYAVLKAKGAELIGAKWESVRLRGKGSAEHVVLQNIIAEALRNEGRAVEIEFAANGKSVDIAEIRSEEAIAYEIELAPSHAHVVENALADLEAGFSEVVIIVRNQSAENEAKANIYKSIPWEKIQRIRFRLLREFA